MSSSKPTTSSPPARVIKGVAIGDALSAPFMQHARDGSTFWWGGVDTPAPPPLVAPGTTAPVRVAVSPVRPGHAVTVNYRVNGGPVREATAVPDLRVHDVNARIFRALLPGQSSGMVEFLPVLHFAGQSISPRLGETTKASRYQIGRAGAVPDGGLPAPKSGSQPHWAWNAKFMGTLGATLRKEVVGATPDGLRIDWHVEDGSFVGPGFEAVILPGGTDWMRIRPDGIGIVNVTACMETPDGARIFASYAGIFDLGPNGFARAQRDEFDPLPALVITPNYLTADNRLAWLNRAQCLGVGRVDMAARRVEADVYIIQVGGRKEVG